jgi:hypothetical protein
MRTAVCVSTAGCPTMFGWAGWKVIWATRVPESTVVTAWPRRLGVAPMRALFHRVAIYLVLALAPPPFDGANRGSVNGVWATRTAQSTSPVRSSAHLIRPE